VKGYLLIRIILILIPSLALGWFGYSYINPVGELAFEYDFCTPETAYFSGLSPDGRVLELDTKKCNQEVVIDPAYFDLRLPQSFEKLSIGLVHSKEGNQNLSFGISSHPTEWSWEMVECVPNHNAPPARWRLRETLNYLKRGSNM